MASVRRATPADSAATGRAVRQARRGSFHIVSLGCAKNTVDSEAMAQLLLAAGHRRAADPGSADLLIVNTCGFIESAKQESIDTLLELGEAKRSDQRLIATGCLVERYPGELAAELPVIDAFVGARVPRHLVTAEALADAARVAPAVAVNVVDAPPLADARAVAAGLRPQAPPRDAEWGERFFHLTDPDGHELSFARPLGTDASPSP
jgi:hypothetical protein